jgi:hypothetical protein
MGVPRNISMNVRAGILNQVKRELDINASNKPSSKASGKEEMQYRRVLRVPSRKTGRACKNSCILSLLADK